MRNALHTTDRAKIQAQVFGDALDFAETNGAAGDVLQGFALDYIRVAMFADDLELEQFETEPHDDELAALRRDCDAKKSAFDTLNAAAPESYTGREHIDAHLATRLADKKLFHVYHRLTHPDPVHRGQRKALVHGDKINTGKYVRINGERVPVLRKVMS